MASDSFARKGIVGIIVVSGGILLLSGAARLTGTFLEDSPAINIHSCQELQGISGNPHENFALASDIDCSSVSPFTPIPIFSGSIDGRGRTISNIKIDVKDQPAGIFAVLDNAVVKNLVLKNITVKNMTSTDVGVNSQHDTGALAGRAEGDVNIQNIIAGDINVLYETLTYDYGTAGGLIGRVIGNEDKTSIILNIQLSQGLVEGRSRIGGLIGSANHVDISNVTTLINVESSFNPNNHNVGGLIGEAKLINLSDSHADAVIDNDYSIQMGSIIAHESNNVGGLIGYISNSTVTRTYALGKTIGSNHVGGLIGFNDDCSNSVVTDSYWGIDSTGIQPARQVEALDEANNCVLQEDIFNGVGLSNEELKDQATFENWDFDQTWITPSYPYAFFRSMPVNSSDENATQIKDCQTLHKIPSDSTRHYILANDIDCSGIPNFIPIKNFKGIFDGNNKTISELKIYNVDGPAGVFSVIQNGKIVNLNLNHVYVSNTSTSGTADLDHDTGALAGSVLGRSEISHINANNITINYSSPGPYTGATGGLIGRFDVSNAEPLPLNLFNVHIALGKVSGTSFVGGLIGYSVGRRLDTDEARIITIAQVSSLMDVTGNTNYIGGLIGSGSFMHLRDSYATARILTASGNEYVTEMGNVIPQAGTGAGVGGLIGNLHASRVERAYSMGKVEGVTGVGAMIGVNQDCSVNPVINSYWNEDSTGIRIYREIHAINSLGSCVLMLDTFNGMPVKDTMLKDQNTYENWDFGNTWLISPYPRLKNLVSGAR